MHPQGKNMLHLFTKCSVKIAHPLCDVAIPDDHQQVHVHSKNSLMDASDHHQVFRGLSVWTVPICESYHVGFSIGPHSTAESWDLHRPVSVQSMADIFQVCHRYYTLLHKDAAQIVQIHHCLDYTNQDNAAYIPVQQCAELQTNSVALSLQANYTD
jgi:hypothetical protein